MRKKLIFNTGALAASNIFVRILGLLYRIWLSRAISNSALGIYQLGMSLYGLLVTLSASGLPNSLSRISAERLSRKDNYGAKEAARTAVNFAFYISIFCVLFMLAGNRLLAGLMLHDYNAWPIILALIPAVVFGGLGAVPVGLLHAQNRSYISAIAEIIEQIAKVLFVVLAFHMVTLSEQGGTMAALLGVGAGSLFSFAIVRLSIGKLPRKSGKQMQSKIFAAAMPLTVSRVLGAGLQLLTAVLVPGQLMAGGLTHEAALSQYGILTGMSMPLMLLPATITSAICVVMLPNVSKLRAAGQINRLKVRVKQSMLLVFGVSMAASLLLFLFAPFLAEKLFNNESAALYMRLLTPFTALSGVYGVAATAINAMGYEMKTFQLGLIGGSILLVFTFFLCATTLGIIGYIAALTLQTVVILGISLVMLANIVKREGKNAQNRLPKL